MPPSASKFKAGDKVVHKSDGKPRGMVVVRVIVGGTAAHESVIEDIARQKRIPAGWYACSWIAGKSKGEDFFSGDELEAAP